MIDGKKLKKNLPIDEFGHTVLTSQKKYERCYFCKTIIVGNPWFTFIQDKNCREHILSVPICNQCSEENARKYDGMKVEGLI